MEQFIHNKGFKLVGTPEEGGFAVVYKAQNNDGIVRAFKTPKIPQNASDDVRRKIKSDFQNECEKLISLGSGEGPNPNIIKAYACEYVHEPYYLEMDYIDGMPFDQYAENHFMKIDEVFHFIENIAGALAYCHRYKDKNGYERCIIHNDLHSANIRYNQVNKDFILFDFGLSMEKGDRVRTSRRNVGWCEFMPPERCSMECDTDSPYKETPATPAWDIYSLGCLIFLSLTGQAPFSIKEFTDTQISLRHIDVDTYRPWEHILELREKHFYEILPDENYKDDCPPWLIDMIEKCMSRLAEDRYPNAHEFLEIFIGFLKKHKVPYDDYIKLSKKVTELQTHRDQLQEAYKTLELQNSKLRKNFNKTIGRNWWVAAILVIAFASNCLPYMGQPGQNNPSVSIATIVISAIACAIIVGIAIYDSIVLNSKNEQ